VIVVLANDEGVKQSLDLQAVNLLDRKIKVGKTVVINPKMESLCGKNVSINKLYTI